MSSFSTKLKGVCPEFESDKNQVSLVAKDFIHPLMKLENKETVSNTFFMEGLSISPRIFIVSGPNAGGKTFFIKTIGALTALALSGLYVSAKYMRVYDFSSIFLEIGDRQNLEQSLSSFSGHLLQMKKIMSVCDSKSLVLLDESFIGTEPNVGAALARSSLDYLANKGAVVFFNNPLFPSLSLHRVRTLNFIIYLWPLTQKASFLPINFFLAYLDKVML